jgi:transcriptional regulator with XRE-family HTH domain
VSEHKDHPSAGSEFLRIALEARSKKADFAREFGVRLDLVGRWTRGERKPTPPMRTRLHDEFGLDWRLWDLDASKTPPAAEIVALVDLARARKAKPVAEESGGAPAETFQRGNRVA